MTDGSGLLFFSVPGLRTKCQKPIFKRKMWPLPAKAGPCVDNAQADFHIFDFCLLIAVSWNFGYLPKINIK